MVYVLLPFMAMSVYSSAEKLDWSLVEAARDLGASKTQAFFHIILKLTFPGLLSGIILTFIPSMGLFFIADILGGNKIVLVGSLIQEQMTRGNNWPFAAALAVIMMVLTTVMIMIYRKITNAKELEESDEKKFKIFRFLPGAYLFSYVSAGCSCSNFFF